MMARFDRRTVSKAAPAAVVRLARFVGVSVPDDCTCDRCNGALVDAVVRRLDKTEAWPPRRLEREG